MDLLAALSSKGQPVWIKWWIFWLCQVQRPVCLIEEMYMLAVPGPRASLAESSGEVEIIWFRIDLLNWNRPPEGIRLAQSSHHLQLAQSFAIGLFAYPYSRLLFLKLWIKNRHACLLWWIDFTSFEVDLLPCHQAIQRFISTSGICTGRTGSIFTVWLPPYIQAVPKKSAENSRRSYLEHHLKCQRSSCSY